MATLQAVALVLPWHLTRLHMHRQPLALTALERMRLHYWRETHASFISKAACMITLLFFCRFVPKQVVCMPTHLKATKFATFVAPDPGADKPFKRELVPKRLQLCLIPKRALI